MVEEHPLSYPFPTPGVHLQDNRSISTNCNWPYKQIYVGVTGTETYYGSECKAIDQIQTRVARLLVSDRQVES